MEERYYHLQNSRIKRSEEGNFSSSLFSHFIWRHRGLCVKFLLFSYGDV